MVNVQNNSSASPKLQQFSGSYLNYHHLIKESFIICTIGQLKADDWFGHVARMGQIRNGKNVSCKNLMENNLGDMRVDGGLLLIFISGKQGVLLWTGLI
jgi:hypothetical protein